MKRITLIISGLLMIAALIPTKAQDNPECSKLFYAYYEKFKRDKYVESYPEWKQVFDLNCNESFKYYENILTDGEIILDELLENHAATKADSTKYGTLVRDIKTRRKNSDIENSIYWESAEAAAEYNFGLVPAEEAYKKLNDVFKRAKIKDSELTAESVNAYFYVAVELYGMDKISASELMAAYSDDVKVIKTNAEKRTLKFNELKLKSDSVTLTREETDDMENYKDYAEYFESIEYSVSNYMSDFLNCDFLTQLYQADYESKKEDLEWLNGAVYTIQNLVEGGCDSEFATQLNDQFVAVYCKQNPEECKSQKAEPSVDRVAQASKGDPDAKCAIDNYKAKNYRKAIPCLIKMVNKTSGGPKGTYAYYLADSYLKTGNRSNAVIWFKKAAQYKPGWAAPYSQLARIFGDKNRINNCGKDNTTKLAAYLVAADYMKKAARYDSSLKPYINQYQAVGSSESTWFKEGYKKGQKVRVTCYGGATTTLR